MNIFETIVERLSARGISATHVAEYLQKDKLSPTDLAELYEEFISKRENWMVKRKRQVKIGDHKVDKQRKLQSREMPVHFADTLGRNVSEELGLDFKELARKRKTGIRKSTVDKMVGDLKKDMKGKKLKF